MQEIKTTLAELDAMRDAYNDDFPMYLAGSYPAIRAYIEKLEREAEAGRVLAEAVEKMENGDIPGIAYDAKIPQDVMSEMSRDMENTMQGFNGANSMWRNLRDAALSAYNSATRDITSKEKEVCKH